MESTLLKLQNGSDVRGVAMATEGGPPVNLTGEAVRQIALNFTAWLAKRTGKSAAALRVGVGHDSRLTAEALKSEVVSGITGAGAKALDCGLASTPAMFMGCVFEETDFDGGMMITASHLPQNRNGLKFFTKDGGTDKGDVTEILSLAAAPAHAPAAAEGCALIDRYAAFLRKKITSAVEPGHAKPLAGLHIVVDAGNGAGGFFVGKVLEPLGADCAGSQYLEPDGHFPNHQPNPENPEAMAAIRRVVAESGADLGIIYDTDVDRMSAVLSDGTVAARNAIIALMAAVLAPENPGATIVTDSVTSDKLTAFIEGTLSMKHHRFKRGYRNVINEAVRLNAEGVDTPLAIETSGHGALRENYFLDDGAYMAVRIIAAAAAARRRGGGLRGLLAGYAEPCAEAERRVTIAGDGFADYGKEVLAAFGRRAVERGLALAEPSYEGVRVTVPGRGWLLLRMSLHDPVMPLNVEGESEADVAGFLRLAAELLAGFERLDLSPLK